MSGVTHGADVEQLDDIARGLRLQGERIGEVGGRGSALLERLRALWDGPDFEEFSRNWRAAHRGIDGAQDAIRTYGKRLMLESDAQRDASGSPQGAVWQGSPAASSSGEGSQSPATATSSEGNSGPGGPGGNGASGGAGGGSTPDAPSGAGGGSEANTLAAAAGGGSAGADNTIAAAAGAGAAAGEAAEAMAPSAEQFSLAGSPSRDGEWMAPGEELARTAAGLLVGLAAAGQLAEAMSELMGQVADAQFDDLMPVRPMLGGEAMLPTGPMVEPPSPYSGHELLRSGEAMLPTEGTQFASTQFATTDIANTEFASTDATGTGAGEAMLPSQDLVSPGLAESPDGSFQTDQSSAAPGERSVAMRPDLPDLGGIFGGGPSIVDLLGLDQYRPHGR